MVPVGLRAGALADFQLICGAGPYELDLLVRDLEAEPTLEFAGQVTRGGWMNEPVPDLPMILVEASRSDVVAEAETDGFGEFGLSSAREGHYGLLLGDGEDAPCVLVWEGAE
jgi:hypothetical protein